MTTDDYKITSLEGLEAVRRVPGMYIGDTEDGTGYHHMLMEVLDNSVDEFLAGHCDNIIITLHKDGSASVEDNGRGIPVYHMEKEKASALEVVLVKLHAGGKFDKKAYSVSGGLHGVGVSVVNALSARLRAAVFRDGKEYTMAFAKGKKVEEISSRPLKRKSGTLIRFIPDPTIFKKNNSFDSEKIKIKLRELSFLCKGLSIDFVDEKNKIKETFGGGTGISDFVKFLAKTKLLDEPVSFIDTKEDIVVDVALQWLDDSSDSELCQYYTNNIPNPDGGSHTAGFKSALTRTINNYITNSDLPKGLKISLSGDDIREGLVAVVSIRHPTPRFSSQTKEKLVSEDARSAVENTIASHLTAYLEQTPATAKKVITRCVNAFKAREAARKARDAVRKSVLASGAGVLPGKLADCQERDPEKCEIFIVEGDSAGGSAKQGRDRRFQAILPLRGKVLNVEKAEFRKMMANEELTTLVTAIGAGIGRSFDPKAIRYNKIIIMTDSDVDGAHIRTLLLTFFFRQMPQLILNGNLYIAVPPLYRVVVRSNPYYLKDDAELAQFVKERKLQRDKLGLQRFKGLGEMNPQQLWDTAMDPVNRKLLQVFIGNYLEADRVFSMLMGTQADVRRDFISERALNAKADV